MIGLQSMYLSHTSTYNFLAMFFFIGPYINYKKLKLNPYNNMWHTKLRR